MYIIVWTIILGCAIGLSAQALLPGAKERGPFVTAGLGVAGAIFGAIIGQALGMYGPRDPVSLMMSAIGSVTTLITYRRYVCRTRSSPQTK